LKVDPMTTLNTLRTHVGMNRSVNVVNRVSWLQEPQEPTCLLHPGEPVQTLM
jgi:hypothetical protein